MAVSAVDAGYAAALLLLWVLVLCTLMLRELLSYAIAVDPQN